MKNRQLIIFLYCLVFLVFYISTTVLALIIFPPIDFNELEKQRWWEENRADMESSGYTLLNR